jgi:hypothetical protein
MMKTEVSERMARRCQEELKSKGYDLDIGTIMTPKRNPHMKERPFSAVVHYRTV